MERVKIKRGGTAVALAVLVLTGCSSINENDSVSECTAIDGTLTEVTVDKNQEGYDPSTDPSLLAARMRDDAEEIQENDNGGWSATFRNQVVGIGEVACEGTDGRIYLTPEGARLSADYGK